MKIALRSNRKYSLPNTVNKCYVREGTRWDEVDNYKEGES